MDVQLALLATIKANVCCVQSVKRRRELVVQSVRIVVLEDMVLIVKNVKLVSIVPLRLMILRRVRCAVLDGINLTRGKQAAYHVRLENINMLKER